jgi:hypothetical protein
MDGQVGPKRGCHQRTLLGSAGGEVNANVTFLQSSGPFAEFRSDHAGVPFGTGVVITEFPVFPTDFGRNRELGADGAFVMVRVSRLFRGTR